MKSPFPDPSPLLKGRDVPLVEACGTVLKEAMGRGEARINFELRGAARQVDGEVVLRLGGRTARIPFEVKRGPNRAGLAQMERRVRIRAIPRTGPGLPRMILLADYVPPDLGNDVVKAGFAYADACGNMDLRLWDRLVIRIRGRRPERIPKMTGDPFGTGPLLQVGFILLTDAEAQRLPYRTVAARAGVALGTVTNTLRQWRAAGLIRKSGRRIWEFTDRTAAIDSWVTGYAKRLRPAMTYGRYRAREDIHQEIAGLRARPHAVPPGWAVTGPTAAEYMTDYYRAAELILMVPSAGYTLPTFMGWLPDRDGPITLMIAPTPTFGRQRAGSGGVPVTHPLLTYAELLARGPGRESEVAEIIRKEHLT